MGWQAASKAAAGSAAAVYTLFRVAGIHAPSKHSNMQEQALTSIVASTNPG
jgi:hypothetical protein